MPVCYLSKHEVYVLVGVCLWCTCWLVCVYGVRVGWCVSMVYVLVGVCLWCMCWLVCVYGVCVGWCVSMVYVLVGVCLWCTCWLVCVCGGSTHHTHTVQDTVITIDFNHPYPSPTVAKVCCLGVHRYVVYVSPFYQLLFALTHASHTHTHAHPAS